MPWYKKLHYRILMGMFAGVIFGVASATLGWGSFTSNWIVPWGKIFVNLLKLVAVPLVLSSLVIGVASLSDIRKLSRIGGKTIGIYIGTTVLAVSIGLVLVNIFQPGSHLPTEVKENILTSYQADYGAKAGMVSSAKARGPLQPFVDMVPDNIFSSAASNRDMLKIVFLHCS
ncbi:MAG: cation:dicarboxylase symporter family transporter [Bdellovibrionota bacterium]